MCICASENIRLNTDVYWLSNWLKDQFFSLSVMLWDSDRSQNINSAEIVVWDSECSLSTSDWIDNNVVKSESESDLSDWSDADRDQWSFCSAQKKLSWSEYFDVVWNETQIKNAECCNRQLTSF